MVAKFYRYCPILEEWVNLDEPCPLKPPSECPYKNMPRCPLVKEMEMRKHERPI
jgi:hypothetical protein